MKCLLVGAIAPPIGNKISPGCLPFGCMALSSFLKQKNIDCEVISTAFPNAVDRIFSQIDKINLLGISSMSGFYLNYAVSVAETVRRIRPKLPIIWGGAHASLMGEDLIKRNLADFVVKGVGENALWMFIRHLYGECSLESVPGLQWIRKDEIIQNGPDMNFDINNFPMLDYSIIEKIYPALLKNEFSYFSSRGCSFNCSYCVASVMYNRRWHEKSEEKVINELGEAYHKYKFRSVFFWDDNLFVNTPRLINILNKLEKLNIRFKFSGFCRVDTFSKMEDKDIMNLKRLGFIWVSFGAESGSQKILNLLNKGIKINQIKNSVTKAKEWDIPCDLSFMGGIPGETYKDFSSTLDLIKWIKIVYPRAAIRCFRFVAYPGMPILKNANILLSNNTYEWANVLYQNAKFPWVDKRIRKILYPLSIASFYADATKNILLKILSFMINFRIRTKIFYLPMETLIFNKFYNRLYSYKLKTFKKYLRSCNA